MLVGHAGLGSALPAIMERDDADWVAVVHVGCSRSQHVPSADVDKMAHSNGPHHGLHGSEHERDPQFLEMAEVLKESAELTGSLRKKRKVVHGGESADQDGSPGPSLRSTKGCEGAASISGSVDQAANLGSFWDPDPDPAGQQRSREGTTSQGASGPPHVDVADFEPVVVAGGEPTGQTAVKRKRGRPKQSKDSARGNAGVGARAQQRPKAVGRDRGKLWGLPSRQLRVKADPVEASAKFPSSEPSRHRQSAAGMGMASHDSERENPAKEGSASARRRATTARTAVTASSPTMPPRELISLYQGTARGKASSRAGGIRMSTKCSRELMRLVEAGLVQDGQRVEYRDPGTKQALKTAVIVQGCCLVCDCCHMAMNLTEFENHTGKSYRRPAKNICLPDGRTLHQCKAQLRLLHPAPISPAATHEQHEAGGGAETAYTGGGAASGSSGYGGVCRLCGDGGDLVYCTSCPTALHLACTDLTAVPDGSWYCPLCRCSICGKSHFQAEGFGGDTILYCDQCSRLYHVLCLRESGRQDLKSVPAGDWFCSADCCKVFWGLGELVGQRFLLPDGFYVAVLREPSLQGQEIRAATAGQQAAPSSRQERSALKGQRELSPQRHRRLLELAQEVMAECFDPIRDDASQDDLIPVVVRSGKTSQRDCTGFYTFLLGRGGDAIAAASVRVYGGEVAEVPLIATRFRFRRQGMCRRLMNQVEKILLGLGVRKLALPSLPEAFGTWKDAFGFERMPLTTRKAFLALDLMSFPGTEFLEKSLRPQAGQKPVHAAMPPGPPSKGNGAGPGPGALLAAAPRIATENAKLRQLRSGDTTRRLIRVTSPGSPEGRKLLGEYRRRRSALADLELLGLVPWYVGVPWMPVEPWWAAAGQGGCMAWRGELYLTRSKGRAPPPGAVEDGCQWLKDVSPHPGESAQTGSHSRSAAYPDDSLGHWGRWAGHIREGAEIGVLAAMTDILGRKEADGESRKGEVAQGARREDSTPCRSCSAPGAMHGCEGQALVEWQAGEGGHCACADLSSAISAAETGAEVKEQLAMLGIDSALGSGSHALCSESSGSTAGDALHTNTDSVQGAFVGEDQAEGKAHQGRGWGLAAAESLGTGEQGRAERGALRALPGKVSSSEQQHSPPGSTPTASRGRVPRAAAVAAARAMAAQGARKRETPSRKPETACVDGESESHDGVSQATGKGDALAESPATPSDPRAFLFGANAMRALASASTGTARSTDGQSRRRLKLTQRGGAIAGAILGDRRVESAPALMRSTPALDNCNGGKFTDMGRGLLDAVEVRGRAGSGRIAKHLRDFSDLEGPGLDHDAAPPAPDSLPAGFLGLARLVELFGPNALSMPLNVSGSEGDVLGARGGGHARRCPRMILPGSLTAPWTELKGEAPSVSLVQGAQDNQQGCAGWDGLACLAAPGLVPAQLAHHAGALKRTGGYPLGNDGQAHAGSWVFASRAGRLGEGEACQELATRTRVECKEVTRGPSEGHREQSACTAIETSVPPAKSLDVKAMLSQSSEESVPPRSMACAEEERGGGAEATRGQGPGDTMPVTAVKEALRTYRTKAAVKQHVWSALTVRSEGRLGGMGLGLLRRGAKADGGEVAA